MGLLIFVTAVHEVPKMRLRESVHFKEPASFFVVVSIDQTKVYPREAYSR